MAHGAGAGPVPLTNQNVGKKEDTVCSLRPWNKIMQSLSSTWCSWKSCCQVGGARATGQRRVWRGRTTLAMRSLWNWAQPSCPSPSQLAEPWACPLLAWNLPWHRASLCKGSCSTPPARPGRDQRNASSPQPPPNFPLGMRLRESELWQFWLTSWSSCANQGILRCHSRIFFLDASTGELIWSKLYLSQDCSNRSKEDTRGKTF